MSERDVDTSSSCDDTSSLVDSESSMVSRSKTSPLSCTLKKSSSPMMQNFLNYDPPSQISDDTYYSSFTYFVSRSVGLGFLCLPYAFKQVGVITALALCFIGGLMFTHSFTTLCRFRYKLCLMHRVPTVPYQNLIEYSLACGPICRWFSTFLR
ncbi:uncharacterized protein LOC115033721 [Acyrthosiphon pisum]|uniref:Amino acid transporter transmembrane domain-containing protein n=1 Tax=Acyrthosiphon pisum TaxID=7029 RepID=A0A8R2JNG9_ACYPI|nr:uncharacterized protein LOC115033721 [Acyrthosiphon pisum]